MALEQAEFTKHLQAADFPGLWVAPVALTTMGPTTALLTANPLTPGANTANVTDPKYQAMVETMATASSEDDRASATADLTDYMLKQAFHNTVVQAQTPVVSINGLTGVKTDLTLAPILTDARLAK